MSRKIKPYMQGEFDSLCGIHAIINALYLLLPDMKWKEADLLFVKLMEEVERKQELPLRVIYDGTSPTLLRHLVSYTAKFLARDRSVSLDVERPFRSSQVELGGLIARLREHVSEGGVAIIHMREDEPHLTVVNKVTGKSIHLFDSCGFKRIRIKQCALKPGKRYSIRASATLFLRRRAEQG